VCPSPTLQVEFEELHEELRAHHGMELARVTRHNEGIWPQVRPADHLLLRLELTRLE
jgi:hypothetical protein